MRSDILCRFATRRRAIHFPTPRSQNQGACPTPRLGTQRAQTQNVFKEHDPGFCPGRLSGPTMNRCSLQPHTRFAVFPLPVLSRRVDSVPCCYSRSCPRFCEGGFREEMPRTNLCNRLVIKSTRLFSFLTNTMALTNVTFASSEPRYSCLSAGAYTLVQIREIRISRWRRSTISGLPTSRGDTVGAVPTSFIASHLPMLRVALRNADDDPQ